MLLSTCILCTICIYSGGLASLLYTDSFLHIPIIKRNSINYVHLLTVLRVGQHQAVPSVWVTSDVMYCQISQLDTVRSTVRSSPIYGHGPVRDGSDRAVHFKSLDMGMQIRLRNRSSKSSISLINFR
jgi:hypothetical protein